MPDCGSVFEIIYNSTGKRPFVIGKPTPMMPQLAMEMMHCAKYDTAVIGDRIYTDVKSGINAETVSILVMSGETTPEILEKSLDKPDLVLNNSGVLLKYL